MMKQYGLLGFFYTSYLCFIYLGFEELAFYMKPFLIPSLILLVVAKRAIGGNKMLLLAILFSTIGDVLLMFTGQLFFILGLLSFLIAHLLYIVIFKQLLEPLKMSFVAFGGAVFVLVYYVGLVSLLWPYLHEMKLPVLTYALVISIMAWLSLHFYNGRSGFKWWIIFGAIMFVISDSLLSIQLFYGDFDDSHFYVMLSYLLAQFSLVYGILNMQRFESK